ncbi:DNA excision repair protein ERCC-1 [Diaphorina citri]|uniref:DNA excision repair protein ERCC-1 n=1 Tax=Diaphorina citri TaxID=121845 RepID=A0A3Q0J721_DIACI|nr:DNA excision repair protein ERCC-1 [Diaphorina citri]
MEGERASTSKDPVPAAQNSATSESVQPSRAGASKSSNAILVNPRQKGNPLLKHIGKVPWEYDDSIIPDYVMGRTTCALFLSIKYHALKPDYIADRIKALGKLYELRVLLVMVDSKDPHHALKYLTRVCLLCDLTLMLAWSPEEAGEMIETYKVFENKPPDLIMEKQDVDPHSKVCMIKNENKYPSNTLPASSYYLRPSKASRLYNVLHQPFLISDNSAGQAPLKKKAKKDSTAGDASNQETGGIMKYLKKPDES